MACLYGFSWISREGNLNPNYFREKGNLVGSSVAGPPHLWRDGHWQGPRDGQPAPSSFLPAQPESTGQSPGTPAAEPLPRYGAVTAFLLPPTENPEFPGGGNRLLLPSASFKAWHTGVLINGALNEWMNETNVVEGFLCVTHCGNPLVENCVSKVPAMLLCKRPPSTPRGSFYCDASGPAYGQ